MINRTVILITCILTFIQSLHAAETSLCHNAPASILAESQLDFTVHRLLTRKLRIMYKRSPLVNVRRQDATRGHLEALNDRSFSTPVFTNNESDRLFKYYRLSLFGTE